MRLTLRRKSAESSDTTPHWYLIAYDISDPRRLIRIHRLLKRRGGLPLQKSLFAWHGGEKRRDKLIRALEKRIRADEDDIRLYPVASLEAIDMWGQHAHTSLLIDPSPEATAWQRLKRWVHTLRRRRQAREAFETLPTDDHGHTP